jgi:hypothetical protein
MKKDLRLTIEDFVTLARFIGGAPTEWCYVMDNKHNQITPNINLYSAENRATQSVTFGTYPLQFEVKLYSNDEVVFRPLDIDDLADLFEICIDEWNALKKAYALKAKKEAQKTA